VRHNPDCHLVTLVYLVFNGESKVWEGGAEGGHAPFDALEAAHFTYRRMSNIISVEQLVYQGHVSLAIGLLVKPADDDLILL
jgi:hypothetical protein